MKGTPQGNRHTPANLPCSGSLRTSGCKCVVMRALLQTAIRDSCLIVERQILGVLFTGAPFTEILSMPHFKNNLSSVLILYATTSPIFYVQSSGRPSVFGCPVRLLSCHPSQIRAPTRHDLRFASTCHVLPCTFEILCSRLHITGLSRYRNRRLDTVLTDSHQS